MYRVYCFLKVIVMLLGFDIYMTGSDRSAMKRKRVPLKTEPFAFLSDKSYLPNLIEA
jgi:hypothetical protein